MKKNTRELGQGLSEFALLLVLIVLTVLIVFVTLGPAISDKLELFLNSL